MTRSTGRLVTPGYPRRVSSTPVGGSPALPAWLEPVRRAAAVIGAEDLTRFVPPDDAEPREGAVLMLFGEGPLGPDLLLTERAHDMRSHPGQVSFPGGSIDPTDPSPEAAALREAQEETGLDPAGVDVFATLPQLWLPPSNFAVTPILGYWRDRGEVRIESPEEVHEIHHVAIADLLDADNRINVRHPSGWMGPGFLIGPERDVILWGFTAGIIARLFSYLGWAGDWDRARVRDLPDHMLQGVPRGTDLAPNTPPNTQLEE